MIQSAKVLGKLHDKERLYVETPHSADELTKWKTLLNEDGLDVKEILSFDLTDSPASN